MADSSSEQGVMNVAREDQDKINRFAKLNSLLEELKDDIKTNTNEIKNYEDAQSEVEVLGLEDDFEDYYIQIGDIIPKLSQDDCNEYLEKKINLLRTQVKDSEAKKEQVVVEMKELKAYLYAKFGQNIHLESSETSD